MRFQQIIFALTLSAVFIHFLSDGTLQKLIRQGSRMGITASRSLQPIARRI